MICKDLNMITFVEFRWEEYDDYDGTDDLNSVDSRTCGRPSKSSPQEGPIRVYQKSLSKSGYGSIPIDTFLVGWTSIYQLFWGSLGTRVLTHPHLQILPSKIQSRCQDQANATPAGVVLGFIRASNPFVRMYQASGNILRRPGISNSGCWWSTLW